MNIFISIDGVLRNKIQKFDYHYIDCYLNTEIEDGAEAFDYGVAAAPIRNDDLLSHYRFQSTEEFTNFLYIEYPIEIFGHAGVSYPHAFTDLNKLMHNNREHTFTLVGLDELGKAKPASLFFLSKNGFLGSDITFRTSNEIDKLWSVCDLWITDNKEIVERCPKGKKVIKFDTDYNKHFTNTAQINKLSEIDLKCHTSTRKNITSTLTGLLNSAKQTMLKLRTSKTTTILPKTLKK